MVLLNRQVCHRLAKVGGSNCTPRGIPTLATGAKRKWKGRSAAEVCTSEARKIGEWLAGARGYLPLAVFAVAVVLHGGALRGRANRPAEVGAEDAKQPQTGGDFLPNPIASVQLDSVAEESRGAASVCDPTIVS
jgi:hypothetical protein